MDPYLWRWVYSKLQLALFAELLRELLHEQRGEAGTCPAAE